VSGGPTTAPGGQDDDGGHSTIRLGDLSGVAAIEDLLAQAVAANGRNWQWSKLYEEAKALAERVSQRTFGVVERETRYVDDPELPREANDNQGGWWESHFREYEFQGRAVDWADWAGLDWDVTGRNGEPLLALAFFYRQIVATEYGLCGRVAGQADDDLTEAETQEIEARLRAEAAKFKRG
jgi:hypothetical protein